MMISIILMIVHVSGTSSRAGIHGTATMDGDNLFEALSSRVLRQRRSYAANLENVTLGKQVQCLSGPRAKSEACRSLPSRAPGRLRGHYGAWPYPSLVPSWRDDVRTFNHGHPQFSVTQAAAGGDGYDDDLKTLSAIDTLLGEGAAERGVAAVSDRYDDDFKTLSALDALLGEEKPSELNTGALNTSQSQTKESRGGDQRVAFRGLVAQLQRQMYMSTLLSRRIGQLPSNQSQFPNVEYIPDRIDVASSIPRQATTVLPFMSMGYALAPGELVVFNLFEPRWVTLFAKLTADASSSRLLRSASGWQNVDLDSDDVLSKATKLYEMDARSATHKEARGELVKGLSGYPMYREPVPGYGRLNEAPFVGGRRFAVGQRSFSFGSQRYPAVGTVMEVVGTDVNRGPGGTPVLVVVARGVERFRATRLMQREPYAVVETVPFHDEAEDGQDEMERLTREKVLEALKNETISIVSNQLEKIYSANKALDAASVQNLKDLSEGVSTEAKHLSALALSVISLRRDPNAAQAVLSSTSAAQRRAVVEQWLSHERQNGKRVLDASSFTINFFTLCLVALATIFAVYVQTGSMN